MKRSKDSTTHGIMSYLVYQQICLCSQTEQRHLVRHEMLISSILHQRNSPKIAIFIHATNIYRAHWMLESMLDAGDKEAAKRPQMLWTKSICSQRSHPSSVTGHTAPYHSTVGQLTWVISHWTLLSAQHLSPMFTKNKQPIKCDFNTVSSRGKTKRGSFHDIVTIFPSAMDFASV